MSGTTVLIVAFASWVTIGLVLSVVLGRRGHDPSTWLVMGALLGPLAIALAAWSAEDEHLDPEIISTGRPAPVAHRTDTVDVLVGYDGSAAAEAAVSEVIELFGGRLGRLKIVSVVRYDPPGDDVTTAREALRALADRIADVAPEIEIAHGRPAQALQQLALDEGFDVLAVGTAGAHHLFASAADDLAEHATVPVLLTGPRAA